MSAEGSERHDSEIRATSLLVEKKTKISGVRALATLLRAASTGTELGPAQVWGGVSTHTGNTCRCRGNDGHCDVLPTEREHPSVARTGNNCARFYVDGERLHLRRGRHE